ncbi:MAG TPA: glycosyltransferase family 39 protein [Gemmatimonadota bacterium]|nr:glycosyltransferase family 39 protein [Gemmatimonadota bacterium]
MRNWLPDALARRPLVPLLVFAAALLLWHLGAYGLWESTEARYAEIATRMVRSGDWITPRLNGIAHFDKPPLAYWASAASMALLGIDELAARLPLALASLAALAVVYRAAADTMCPRAALYAFLILLSSPLWFALSRSLTTDLYLTLWIVIAADAGRRGTRPGGSRAWRVAAWAALGAGFLTKGPVVFLWTALPLLAWAAWTRSWGRAARLADPLGLAAFALLALPWYVVEASLRPGLMEYWLGRQVEGRIVAPYRGEHEPWWTYLVTLGWAAWVWIIPGLAGLWRLARERDHAGGRLLAVWVAVPLVAFSLLPTKRANYMLPAMPAIALAAGWWWDRAIAGLAPARRTLPGALAVAVGSFGAALTIASFVVEDVPAELISLGWLFGPSFLLGGVAGWRATRGDRLDLAFTACLLPLLGLYLGLVVALGQPHVETWSKISRPLVRQIEAHRLADEPIVNYHVWLRAIPFYLDGRVITISEEGRVTSFEEDDRWQDYTFTADSSFFRMMEEPVRRLAVVRRTEVRDIETALGQSVAVLASDSRFSLITNRPTPAERAEGAAGAP